MATKKKKKKPAPPKKKTKAKAAPKKKKAKVAAPPPPKKRKKKPTGQLPTAAEEARFWSLLEDAWATQSKEVNDARLALSKREPGSEADTEILDEAIEEVIESLRTVFAFEEFPKEELVAMDRVLERKLYEVDRSEIQEVTDGSDDGFLYARGFIVVLGKAFFDAVNANPKMAIDDLEAETMCYLPATVHEERFGDYPETGSGISRESCSNDAGWPDL